MIVETRLARWTPSPTAHLISALVLASLACSGRSNVAVGGPCRLDESCVTGVCLRESGQEERRQWQGGYCSGNCAGQDRACPSGGCLRLEDGKSYCVSHCTQNADCRDGYVCATTVEACLPDCRLGWSCGSTLSCDAHTGTCELPGVPPGPVGAPCTWNVDCASGVCTPETSTSGPTHWTGGSCTQECTPTVPCPAGSVCIPFEPSGAYCVGACDSTMECRSGYVCALDVRGCLPDCRLGWSCGSSLLCDAMTGLCVPPSAGTPDAAPDAGMSHDARSDDPGQRDAMGGGGRGGAGGPGPGGPTWASLGSVP